MFLILDFSTEKNVSVSVIEIFYRELLLGVESVEYVIDDVAGATGFCEP